MRYPHLFLVDWPFHIVPEDRFCNFMADREQLNKDIKVLLRNLSRRDTSTINIMWSYHGAGKTHTLKYVSNQSKNKYENFIPIYNEFPRDTKSFLDLYRSFIEKIDLEIIQDSYLEVFTSPRKDEAQRKLHLDFPDLSHAVRVISTESGEKLTNAWYWLRGQNVPLRDLKYISINSRIDTAEKALKAIEWLVQLFNWSKTDEDNRFARMIWMIDEFQRITSCRKPVQEDINACLLSVFNRCPRSFSLFLSFSGNPKPKAPSWLPKDLIDRIGIEKVLILPPLTTKEATTFIVDVLVNYRDKDNAPPSKLFPFDEGSINTIIEILQKKTEIKPRTVMQACNAVLEEADILIEEGKLKLISKGFVAKVLKDRVFIDTGE